MQCQYLNSFLLQAQNLRNSIHASTICKMVSALLFIIKIAVHQIIHAFLWDKSGRKGRSKSLTSYLKCFWPIYPFSHSLHLVDFHKQLTTQLFQSQDVLTQLWNVLMYGSGGTSTSNGLKMRVDDKSNFRTLTTGPEGPQKLLSSFMHGPWI